MKSVVCGLFLIGCASAPMYETQAVRDDAHVLGMLPVRNIVGVEKAYELVLCKVSSEYTEEYLQENCKPALVTKGNRRVLFSQAPELNEGLGRTELWLLSGSLFIPPTLFALAHRHLDMRKEGLSMQQLQKRRLKSHRVVAGLAIASLTALAIVWLHQSYFWGADKRELKRLRNDIFKTDVDFSNAIMSKKDITKLLAVLAKKLDLQVSREAQIPISNTQ